MAKESLKFYDLKAKRAFNTSTYTLVNKGGRTFAKTTSPSGVTSMRIVGKSK